MEHTKLKESCVYVYSFFPPQFATEEEDYVMVHVIVVETLGIFQG